MGYKWESSRVLCTLTATDGTKIPLARNRYNGFWYFNALKIHHDTDLTRKEIARQIPITGGRVGGLLALLGTFAEDSALAALVGNSTRTLGRHVSC